MTYFLALFKMENGNKDPQEYPLIIIECQEKKNKIEFRGLEGLLIKHKDK